MKNFKHEFKEWLIVVAQGSVFLVMFVVFIFAAMSAGCGGQETVRPVVDAEEVQDTEDFDEVVDESVDETADEVVDEEESDEEESDEEDSDIEAPDEEEDSDEVPDTVEEGWTQVVTAGTSQLSIFVSCGIYKEDLYCWGMNDTGVFGNGTLLSSTKPVPAGGDYSWKKVLLSATTVIGLTVDGDIYRWGDVAKIGDTEFIKSPIKVSAPKKFTDICYHATQQKSCGLTDDNQEWCYNSENQEMVYSKEGIVGYWPDLVPDITMWSVSPYNKVGLLEGGRVVAYSILKGYRDWPNPLRDIPETSLLTQIDGRLTDEDTGKGSYCATDLNKELWCWTPFETTGSIKHTGDYTFWYNNILSDVVSVSRALSHTCAVTTAGRLYCWGSNKEGQLGLGYASETAVTEPQEVIIY